MDELDGSYQYGYDAGGQLVSELFRDAASAVTVYQATYTYDGVGNRLRQVEADGTVTSYTYNAAQELLATLAAGPESESVTTFAPFVPAPLSGSAVGLSLALESGRVYTVEAASLSLVGATGTYDSANRWDLALESRTSAGAVPPAWGWRLGGEGGS